LIDWFGKVRKPFFFEKNKQKTFLIWGAGVFTGKGPDNQSFFCLFFVHKKEGSSCRAKLPIRSSDQRAGISEVSFFSTKNKQRNFD